MTPEPRTIFECEWGKVFFDDGKYQGWGPDSYRLPELARSMAAHIDALQTRLAELEAVEAAAREYLAAKDAHRYARMSETRCNLDQAEADLRNAMK